MTLFLGGDKRRSVSGVELALAMLVAMALGLLTFDAARRPRHRPALLD